jgi:hypothetical protein
VFLSGRLPDRRLSLADNPPVKDRSIPLLHRACPGCRHGVNWPFAPFAHIVKEHRVRAGMRRCGASDLQLGSRGVGVMRLPMGDEEQGINAPLLVACSLS